MEFFYRRDLLRDARFLFIGCVSIQAAKRKVRFKSGLILETQRQKRAAQVFCQLPELWVIIQSQPDGLRVPQGRETACSRKPDRYPWEILRYGREARRDVTDLDIRNFPEEL